jgi:uncharacterized protein
MASPQEILSAILEKPTDLDQVRSLVSPDVTYVSLNYNNPDLKKIMPWAGTSRGPESIVKTFEDVSRFWQMVSFEPEALLGSDTCAAMFGRFTYKSTVLGKTVTSPFAVFARCQDGRCTYLPQGGYLDVQQRSKWRNGRYLTVEVRAKRQSHRERDHHQGQSVFDR